jgi:hypothetical protein
VNTLSKPGPKKQPYLDLNDGDVAAYPISNASHILNPVDTTLYISYRNNTTNPAPTGGPTIHNRFSVDLWASNCELEPTGINNWGKDK